MEEEIPLNLKRKYELLGRAYRKQAEAFSKFRRNFYSLLENINDGVFMVDQMGRITFVNKEVERISGYSKHNILKQHFRMFLSLDDLADGFKLFYETLGGTYTHLNLFRIRRQDRSTAVVEIHTAPFYLDGKVAGGIAFLRNLADRKKVEEVNRSRVESFIKFNKDLEDWHSQVESLKKEVNDLLHQMGKEDKYKIEYKRN